MIFLHGYSAMVS